MGGKQRRSIERSILAGRLMDHGVKTSNYLRYRGFVFLAEELRRGLGIVVLAVADEQPLEGPMEGLHATLDLVFQRIGVGRDLVATYAALQELEISVRYSLCCDRAPTVWWEPPPEELLTTAAWLPPEGRASSI